MSAANATDLTDGGATTLHTHAASGSWELIEDKYLSAADAASFDFTSIPAIYKQLKILLATRTSSVGSEGGIMMKFQNDAGNYYMGSLQWMENTTVGTLRFAAGQAPFTISYTVGNTATAGCFGNTEILILNYNAPVNTSWQVRGTEEHSVYQYVYDGAGQYLKTDTIDRITLYPASGMNWKRYSRATLYGLK
jgi:hypothetical protein